MDLALHWFTSRKGIQRSPFSLLLAKGVGPNNCWLRQFKIVGVGATIGPFVGATFGTFARPPTVLPA